MKLQTKSFPLTCAFPLSIMEIRIHLISDVYKDFITSKQAVSPRYPNNISIYGINLRSVERIDTQSSSEVYTAKQSWGAVNNQLSRSLSLWSHTYSLTVQLHDIAANSWKQSQQGKWKQGKNNLGNDRRARKSRSKNCNTISWEADSMMSTTKVNYLTLLPVIWLLNSCMYQAQRQLGPTNRASNELHKELLLMVKFKA